LTRRSSFLVAAESEVQEKSMRAEVEQQVEEIRQSLALLRRHL
jgi:hypothetical protein